MTTDAEDLPLPRMEWRSYDTAELFYLARRHGGTVDIIDDDHYCSRCFQDPRHTEICEWEITSLYRNLLANLVAVVSLAAAAQRARDAGLVEGVVLAVEPCLSGCHPSPPPVVPG